MPNTEKQTANYVSEMSAELAKLAASVGNESLATLLRMAAKVAKQQAKQGESDAQQTTKQADSDAKTESEPRIAE